MLPKNEGDFAKNLYTVSRLLNTQYERILEPFGISLAQGPIIGVLAERDGITQEMIAEELRIAKSAVSLAVKQLMAKGILRREPDAADRRAYRIYFTETGKSMVPQLEPLVAAIQDRVTDQLTPCERLVFADLVAKVSCRAVEVFADGKTKSGSAD